MTIKSIGTLFLMMSFLTSAATVSATETANSNSLGTDNVSSKVKLAEVPSADALACVQTALDKRDNAIISAFDAFSATVKTALQTRRDALKTAWGLTDKRLRRLAIKKAWSDFGVATKTARRTLNKARLAAWVQYAKDGRVCKSQGAPTSDDYGTQGQESNL